MSGSSITLWLTRTILSRRALVIILLHSGNVVSSSRTTRVVKCFLRCCWRDKLLSSNRNASSFKIQYKSELRHNICPQDYVFVKIGLATSTWGFKFVSPIKKVATYCFPVHIGIISGSRLRCPWQYSDPVT